MADELVNMSEQFKGLPMADLIGGPLKAASDAQVQLAKSVVDFINTVGFDTKVDDQGNVQGPGAVRTVNFAYSRQAGAGDKEDVEINVPMLAIVQIPNLMIDTVDVNFDMEVKSSFKHEDSNDSSAKLAADLKFGWGVFSGTVHIEGSIASHQANTRTSDNSAKYHVEVHAKQAGTPEGLARVLDMMNQSITPVVKKDPEPAPKPA
jgi:hypothetical protein